MSHLAPSSAKAASIERLIGDVAIDQRRRIERRHQRCHALLEGLALIGEGQFGPGHRCRAWAMPQAMERSLATPMTSPRLPFMSPLALMELPFDAIRPSVCTGPGAVATIRKPGQGDDGALSEECRVLG